MQSCNLPPELLEQLVADLIGVRELEWLEIRLAGDKQCVVLGSEADRNHLGHPDTGSRGHHRRQGFVLDLLEPSDRSAARRIAIGEKPPAPCQPLSVLGVPTQHTRLQLSSIPVAPKELRGPDPLSLGGLQLADVDAE
jgi:hypothetical protein